MTADGCVFSCWQRIGQDCWLVLMLVVCYNDYVEDWLVRVEA